MAYKVLLIRALNTSSNDDIAFDPDMSDYMFDALLSDQDKINRIGEEGLILTFKPQN